MIGGAGKSWQYGNNIHPEHDLQKVMTLNCFLHCVHYCIYLYINKRDLKNNPLSFHRSWILREPNLLAQWVSKMTDIYSVPKIISETVCFFINHMRVCFKMSWCQRKPVSKNKMRAVKNQGSLFLVQLTIISKDILSL